MAIDETLAAINPEKGEQPAVARAEVEDATSAARHMLEQDAVRVVAAWVESSATVIAIDGSCSGHLSTGARALGREGCVAAGRDVAVVGP
jgi:hypothetical protein